MIPRDKILQKFRDMVAKAEPIVVLDDARKSRYPHASATNRPTERKRPGGMRTRERRIPSNAEWTALMARLCPTPGFLVT